MKSATHGRFQKLKNAIIASPTSNAKWDEYARARAIAKDKEMRIIWIMISFFTPAGVDDYIQGALSGQSLPRSQNCFTTSNTG